MNLLSGKRWDAVVNTCGYVPRVVRKSADLLAAAVRQYVFVSSGSVYADLSCDGIDEGAPVTTLEDETNESVTENYGALKALCERAVESAMPERALVVRSGLIVGPYDQTGRLICWIRRVKEGGEVLAPGTPERRVQLIRARDMANWIIRMIESARTGIYNVTGPASQLTMGELLQTCREASGSNAEFTWIDEDFLDELKVAPFSEMPLWLPGNLNGLLSLDIGKAIAVGLSFQPLLETFVETMDWDRERLLSGGKKPERLASGAPTHAGISREREREILNAWHSESRAARQT